MDYQPGDIVNGHMLGTDNAWHPVASAPLAPRGRPMTYGERYKARWKRTALVFAGLGVLAVVPRAQTEGGAALLIDMAIACVTDALLFGTVVNFIVAAVPGRART